MIKPHRRHTLWLAYAMHRLSGVLLALFLPLHFYVLGLALQDTTELDRVLNWTQLPLVKFAEFGLVFLLAVHLFGGLRILALEWLPWSARQKTYAAAAVASSFLMACGFLLNVF